MPELSDVITELRAEISRAMRSAADHDLQFEVGPIELEVTVAVTDGKKGDGKLKLWVVETGGELSKSQATTHRVLLTLTPTSRSKAPIKVTGAAFEDEY
ncbi:trypco2 family protein [Nonomuraea sp. NPDC050663]|uniref:trypco2 family protein n=1 Tax=Nonomuraea sp. NPDC050663 TaxID=3364370 RepID=UPI0037B8D0C3